MPTDKHRRVLDLNGSAWGWSSLPNQALCSVPKLPSKEPLSKSLLNIPGHCGSRHKAQNQQTPQGETRCRRPAIRANRIVCIFLVDPWLTNVTILAQITSQSLSSSLKTPLKSISFIPALKCVLELGAFIKKARRALIGKPTTCSRERRKTCRVSLNSNQFSQPPERQSGRECLLPLSSEQRLLEREEHRRRP